MPLFQSTILKKYTNALNTATVDAAYERFTAHFHNPVIQENIRLAKEEQYQGEFLIDLFVRVLGYVKNPTPAFNLTTEFKNIKDSKKADGAIISGEIAVGVIELKGTAVTDLGRIEVQAFGYKNNQPGCVYVITSSFEKLRFYIDNAVDFEEFHLFQLSRERFNVLWLCLSAEQLLAGKPKQLKEESLSQEEQITKQLYKDYSLFRNEVFQNIVAGNPQYDKLTLFKQTQKLLDRFLFIFFAEDRLLLPPNSILAIVQQWKELRDKYDEYQPLYDRFKKYFGYMNTGHKGQKHDIFAYNGGLFKPDAILDNLTINDELLSKHVVNLSNYDFESEVSVNILGHIFEHSLNEIEDIQAELEGHTTNKSSSKRKKDGVFYTPKYITKYIVDNTVGKLCEEQKAALDIEEAEYDKGRKNRPIKVVKALDQKLKDYRAWLLQLTICDPACGSGAFLNQALEFLIAEHGYIDELYAKLYGDAISLYEVENSILEHNLYGVDINNESVEIAKLSLWLRTAQKGRKLSSLNNNIKCGNSLIDEPAVAGDKAFNWEKEFPQVFVNGGFDVVIGNPPYVRQELINSRDKEWLSKNYEVGNGTADLYVYFYERSISILKIDGMLGFITPNKFYKTKYGENLRNYLVQFNMISLIDFFELKVFEDASTDSQVIVIKNNKEQKILKYSPIITLKDFSDLTYESISIDKSNLSKQIWIFLSKNDSHLLDKISKNSVKLSDFSDIEIYLGVKTAANNAFIINKKTKNKLVLEDPKAKELIKPYISATDIKGYHLENEYEYYLINTGYDIDVFKYPSIVKWLSQFEEQLFKRLDKGIHHYNLRACSYYEKFEKPKILFIYTAVNHQFKYDEKGFYVNNSCFIICNANKFLSGYLNSKFFKYYKKLNFVAYGNAHTSGRVKLDRNKMKNVPIPKATNQEKEKISLLVNLLTTYSENEYNTRNLFKTYFVNKYNFEINKKLENWHELDFSDFIKELSKAIKIAGGFPLSKKDEFEWLEVFENNKKKAQALQNDINRLDKEIDVMVYGLYGLTEEEIAIVEGS